MNRKRAIKLISAALMLILLITAFSPYTYATSGDDWIKNANQFVSNGQKGNGIDTTKIQNALMPVGRILVTIGTVVLAAVTIIMGIKYMMCDNPDKKAKLKIQLIGLVVSTIVIFGAQVIWSLLYNFMIDVTK